MRLWKPFCLKILLPLLAALFAASCMKRDELAVTERDTVSFSVYLQQNRTQKVKSSSLHITAESEIWDLELSTKAVLTSKLEGAAKVLGYTYSSSISSDQVPWSPLSNAEFRFNGDELKSSASVRWGEVPDENIRIFVYAPVSIAGATVSTAGGPVISYTLPPYMNADGLRGRQTSLQQ